MRLTLRTLLAYLDDTLDPGEIREIGQKVAESDAAQELIARIKQVTRRRRLTTPPATGPNARFDANSVSEYLDSVLPSDQVSEVEKTCLESDVHLAEIAACHQILTLVLGEPALVPPTAHQRMYALAQGREAAPRKARAPVVAPPAHEGDGSEADEKLLLGMAPLGRGKAPPWLVPAAAGALVLALGVALWMAMPGKTDRRTAPTTSPFDAIVDANAGDPNRDKRPAEQPVEELSRPPRLEQPVAAPNGTAAVTPPVAGKIPKPSSERRVIGKADLVPGLPSMLLQRTDDKGTWRRLRPEISPISSGDLLLAPPGFRSEVRLDNKVQILLWGNVEEQLRIGPLQESALTLHAVPSDLAGALDVDFTLDRGRVVVGNPRREPARVRTRFHEETWDLTLQPDAEIGLELIGRDGGFETGDGPLASLLLIVLRGNVQLRLGYHHYTLQAPPGPALFTWNNRGPGAQGPHVLETMLPAWGKNLPASWQWERLTPAEQKAQLQAFENMQLSLNEFSSRLTDKAAINVKLVEDLTTSSRPAARVLAVRCLGATDALHELLDALADEKHPEVSEEAVTALRHWLGRRDGQDKLLRTALAEKRYTTSQSEILLQLLHTFTGDHLAKRQTYEVLIEYLRDDKPAVRRLAFWHLYRLVPEARKTPQLYDPGQGVQQRQDAYDQWKRLLADGKLPPRTQPPR